MTKEKRLLPAILYITVLVLLIIFLAGQCLIVGMFGPNGSYIKLGLNGYPDYIAMMIVSNSKKPYFSDDGVTSSDNLNGLIDHIRYDVSSQLYLIDETDEMMSLFLNGELRFKSMTDSNGRPASVSRPAEVSGGRLSSLIDWSMSNRNKISDYVNAPHLDFDYTYKMENITIKNKGTSAHMAVTISMYKTYLTSFLSDTTNAAMQYIETTIKTDKVYFTLDFVLEVENTIVSNTRDLNVSVNDAGFAASAKLVEYINVHTDSIFDNIATDVSNIIKHLGHIEISNGNIIVREKI